MKDLTAACSWSSGKDSCLALHRAIKEGFAVKYLLNFISCEHRRVSFHGAKAELVELQADSLGIPILQRETTEDNYEEVFRRSLRELKERNVSQLVRGDIHLQDLQDWVENTCAKEDIKVISPIWHDPAEKLLKEFIGAGFKAIVTSAQSEKLSKDWVGRIIDEGFVRDMKKIKNVDLCGEMGEYHSFVFDGPIFSKRISIKKTDKLLIKGYWFLDIQEYKLVNKRR